jgi:hypothetical protein
MAQQDQPIRLTVVSTGQRSCDNGAEVRSETLDLNLIYENRSNSALQLRSDSSRIARFRVARSEQALRAGEHEAAVSFDFFDLPSESDTPESNSRRDAVLLRPGDSLLVRTQLSVDVQRTGPPRIPGLVLPGTYVLAVSGAIEGQAVDPVSGSPGDVEHYALESEAVPLVVATPFTLEVCD